MPFELGGITTDVKPHGRENWQITIQNQLIGEQIVVASRTLFTRDPKVGEYATIVSQTPLEDFVEVKITKHRPSRMRQDLNCTLALANV